MRRLILLFCALLCASCAALVPTDRAVQGQAGLTVHRESSRSAAGTLLRIKGAPWLRGGEAAALFQREAAALAKTGGCRDYRIDGLSEGQEDTMLGTRRVMQGTLVCLDP